MSTSVQLDIEVDVLTAGSAAEVVNSILESLLYQRNQIPIVYKTYRYYVNKWLENEENERDAEIMAGVVNFQLQRQRDRAKITQKSISCMREEINEAFARKHIKCLRFLFGGTAFTPREAYTIHIPTKNILMNHCYDHHRINPAKLNETLLSLLTSEDLYSIFSNNLNPTNMYLEFELLDHPIETSTSSSFPSKPKIFPKDYCIPPPSCKDIHIHLIHKRTANIDDKQLKCCKELQIFEDIISLNIDSKGKALKGEENHKTTETIKEGNTRWWESEIVVRGFKEQSVKGCNMWS